MKEYVENMKDYLGICEKYEVMCEKYKRIRGICENMKKYVALGLGRASRLRYFPPYIKALGLGTITSSFPIEGSGIWKNSQLHPQYRLRGLKERSEVRVVVHSFPPM